MRMIYTVNALGAPSDLSVEAARRQVEAARSKAADNITGAIQYAEQKSGITWAFVRDTMKNPGGSDNPRVKRFEYFKLEYIKNNPEQFPNRQEGLAERLQKYYAAFGQDSFADFEVAEAKFLERERNNQQRLAEQTAYVQTDEYKKRLADAEEMRRKNAAFSLKIRNNIAAAAKAKAERDAANIARAAANKAKYDAFYESRRPVIPPSALPSSQVATANITPEAAAEGVTAVSTVETVPASAASSAEPSKTNPLTLAAIGFGALKLLALI